MGQESGFFANDLFLDSLRNGYEGIFLRVISGIDMNLCENGANFRNASLGPLAGQTPHEVHANA